jgi:hypothetical protein
MVIEAVAGGFTVSNIAAGFGGFISRQTITWQINAAEIYLGDVLALFELNKSILEQAELHRLLARYDRFSSTSVERLIVTSSHTASEY